jgi:hypothetical protein
MTYAAARRFRVGAGRGSSLPAAFSCRTLLVETRFDLFRGAFPTSFHFPHVRVKLALRFHALLHRKSSYPYPTQFIR